MPVTNGELHRELGELEARMESLEGVAHGGSEEHRRKLESASGDTERK